MSSRAVMVATAGLARVGSWWSNQTPRCSSASCSTAAAWSGSHCNRASCSTGFRAGIRLCRPVTARCRSTNPTDAGERPVVARATWRAFQACNRPSWTSAQSRGSRKHSSTASLTRCSPAGNDRSRAAASSSTAYCATPGVPTPASGTSSAGTRPWPRGPRRVPARNTAAGCCSVTGCRSTQCTAAASSRASSRSALRRAETTASSAAARSRSRSPDTPVPGSWSRSAVVVMTRT